MFGTLDDFIVQICWHYPSGVVVQYVSTNSSAEVLSNPVTCYVLFATDNINHKEEGMI